MRILIVDDDEDQRTLLAKHLCKLGACDFAANGFDALYQVEDQMNEDEPYDLICLDICMPSMDGHTTLKAIRSLEDKKCVTTPFRAKVIMITAVRSVRTVMELFSDLCDGYLAKPYTREKLFRTLGTLGLTAQE